ncbi:MAG: immunity 53 family protein [Chloroflexota bacterium]
MELFLWLENFLLKNSDGEWEHGEGIQIQSLDNPGWSVMIDLTGTDLQDSSFPEVDRTLSEHNWLVCRKEEAIFQGFGGPTNLTQILSVFQAWSMQTTSVPNSVMNGKYNGHIASEQTGKGELYLNNHVNSSLAPVG